MEKKEENKLTTKKNEIKVEHDIDKEKKQVARSSFFLLYIPTSGFPKIGRPLKKIYISELLSDDIMK